MNLPQRLSVLCFLVSQGIILISYVISFQLGHVETCNPFFQGCLNITDAGIQSPEGYWFRGGMISACALFCVWWAYNHEWIKNQLPTSSKLNHASAIIGIVGAICLIVATAVLIPERKDIDWTVHVAGAIFFFILSFLAQIINTYVLYKSELKSKISDLSYKCKLINVIVQGIMIATFLVLEFSGGSDLIINAIEWWLALLIALYFLTGYWDWKDTD